MRFKAEIAIMPLENLLDPQGKAVKLGLKNLSIKNITNVRIGKYMYLELEADTFKEAEKQIIFACKRLLVNPIMESYKITINKSD